MYAKDYHDLGTPAANGARRHARNRRRDGHGAGGHIHHARRGAGGRRHPEAVRHGHAEGLRFLPRVPGRDRGPQRISGLMHHRSGRGHEGAHAQRGGERSCAAACSSCTSPNIPMGSCPDSSRCELETLAHAARHRRVALRGCGVRRATCARRSPSTPAIRISASTTTCASSARAACAPAKTRRARSR